MPKVLALSLEGLMDIIGAVVGIMYQGTKAVLELINKIFAAIIGYLARKAIVVAKEIEKKAQNIVAQLEKKNEAIKKELKKRNGETTNKEGKRIAGQKKKKFRLWKVNLKEGKLNCANCAIATDATLAGNPASAIPWTYIKVMENGQLINRISFQDGTHMSVLEKEFGSRFLKNVNENVIKSMLKLNQRGIVFGYNKDSKIGHVFNAVNQNGVVKFIDGQTGKKAVLNYDFYELLPTNF